MRTIHVHQGTTYRASFDWLANAATPTPIPLAGYVVTFLILARAGKLPALITVDSTTDQVVVEPGSVTGRVAVTLTASQTGNLKRDGAYEIRASPISVTEPVEYVVSGPMSLVKVGA